jgi:glycosyltransferase involved in cell wall biosynthesis
LNVLLISPFPARPLYGGAVVRIHHLARYLARRHRLYRSCRGPALPEEDAVTIGSSSSRWAQLLDPMHVFRLRSLVLRERVDCIIASSVLTGLTGPLLKRLTGRLLVFDDHNVEFVQMRRSRQRAWPLMRLLERWICRSADLVTCVSEIDRQTLIAEFRLAPGKVVVVPNGATIPTRCVDVGRIRQELGLVDEALFLFFGVLGYSPNAQAARILVDEIVPRLRARGRPFRLFLVGAGTPPPLPPEVRFLGFVDDVTPLVRAAHAVLAPLTSGGGTRMKILETVACGRPVVTTTVGVEGLDLAVLGEGVRVRDDWDAFADEAARFSDWSEDYPPTDAFRARYTWEAALQAWPT